MAQIEFRDATITILDGTVPSTGVVQNTLEIKSGEGNFQWTESQTIEYRLDKGNLDTVREGDQVPIDLSFEFIWESITGNAASGSLPTVEDALKRIGNASTWVSSSSDGCEPYAVDIELFHDVPCNANNEENETITFADFRWDTIDHDLQASQISVVGRCNITTPTIVKEPST